jgi:hypothetical protein
VEPVQLAAVLAAVVVLASMLSVELGVAVALLELGLGVVVGNVFDLHSQESALRDRRRHDRRKNDDRYEERELDSWKVQARCTPSPGWPLSALAAQNPSPARS